MANISDILNRPAENVEAPKPLPVGSYLCVIKGLPEQGESSKRKTPYLRFTYQITSPLADVDEDAIKEYEAISSGESSSIIGRTLTNDYYTTEAALFMLTDFLGHCGIDFSGGKSISAAIDETPNTEVVVVIKHEESNNGRWYARVARTANASEAEALSA